MDITTISSTSLEEVIIRILIAMLCGFVIGCERFLSGKAAGIRIHIIVCIGSALTAFVEMYACTNLGFCSDTFRISAQVISGIGVLGVGAILIKGGSEITGLTTASGLWTTSIIGISLGIGYYKISLFVAILTFITILIFNRLEYLLLKCRKRFDLYIELKDIKYVQNILNQLGNCYHTHNIVVIPPRSGIVNNVGIEFTLILKKKKSAIDIQSEFQEMDEIIFVLVAN